MEICLKRVKGEPADELVFAARLSLRKKTRPGELFCPALVFFIRD
jgi:hypothetical protein